MKNKYRFTAVLLCTVAFCAYLLTSICVKSQTEEGKEPLLVVTSFYPMYIATRNVVGECEGIEIKSLSEPQTGCLHDFQLTPEDMKLLSKADVFVVNGGGMETFLTDVAKQYPKLAIVEAITGEEARDDVHKKEQGYDEEHMHQEGVYEVGYEHTHEHENAHVWMSVKSHRAQIYAIADGLCEVLHQKESETEIDNTIARIESNVDQYDAKLADLEAQQKEVAEAAAGSRVISLHDSYEYIAKDYGLEICYTLNLDEERQVSAGEVADVLTVVKKDGIHIIFAEELYGKELAETVKKEADVEVYYLDTLVRGDYDVDSYIKGMQENIEILRQAFGVR